MIGFYKKNDLLKLFEFSSDLMCATSESGYFIQINPAFTQTLGYLPEDIERMHFTDLVHPDDVQITQNLLSKHQTSKKIERFENRCLNKEGHYIWLSWQFLSYPLERKLIAIARDISDFKQACMALKESEKHLNSLINDVFQYKKTGPDEVLTNVYMDLNDLIAKIELSLSKLLNQKKATLVYHELPIIFANESVLYIVIKNLIEKSLTSAHNSNPVIEIRYHQSKQKNYLSIKNNDTKTGSLRTKNGNSLKKIPVAQVFQSNDMALLLTQKILEKVEGQISFSPPSLETGCIYQISFPIVEKTTSFDPPLEIYL